MSHKQKNYELKGVEAIQAAKTMCEHSKWGLSNLQLQKILYIAQLYWVGLERGSLINDTFQAWNYGPVLPSVFHEVKIFGSNPIENIFQSVQDICDPERKAFLQNAVDKLKAIPPSNLIGWTHHDNGAWASCYVAGQRNVNIPYESIVKEYNERIAK